MEKIMRNAPSLAILITLILQVTRVSEFGERLGAGILAVVFALFLGSSIYVLSYWQAKTRYEITAEKETERAKYAQQMRMKRTYDNVNRTAGGWLAAFVIIEGYLNLAETMAKLPENLSIWEFSGAMMYGVFPTLAAFGLGNLQALIDKVPHGVANKSAVQVMFEAFAKRMETQYGAQSENALQQTHDTPHSQENASQNAGAVSYPVACPHGCGEMIRTPGEYSAHIGRWCKIVRARKLEELQRERNASFAEIAPHLPTAYPPTETPQIQ